VHPYSWPLDAETLVLVPASLVVYAGALRLFPAPRWRIAAFAGGQALILAAFLTPVETISLHYLLSAHLLQNVVLAEWAPALCVLGIPPALAGVIVRARAVRELTRPVVALPIWLVTYFVWHVPWVYDTALEHPSSVLHVEHGCYLAAGVLLWWPVLQHDPWKLSAGAAAAYVFAAFMFASPLGLLLALLPEAIYSFYEARPRLWGLSALTDQQIAGLTMAAEQALVFFAVFSTYFLRFLRSEEGVLLIER
jgi:cytochrome c oxidase assembly factor CtaG